MIRSARTSSWPAHGSTASGKLRRETVSGSSRSEDTRPRASSAKTSRRPSSATTCTIRARNRSGRPARSRAGRIPGARMPCGRPERPRIRICISTTTARFHSARPKRRSARDIANTSPIPLIPCLTGSGRFLQPTPAATGAHGKWPTSVSSITGPTFCRS